LEGAELSGGIFRRMGRKRSGQLVRRKSSLNWVEDSKV
jgi:hypothetical protein